MCYMVGVEVVTWRSKMKIVGLWVGLLVGVVLWVWLLLCLWETKPEVKPTRLGTSVESIHRASRGIE